MKHITYLLLLKSFSLFLFLLLMYPHFGYSLNRAPESTIENQTSVEVTIYNKNFALIREKRNMTFLPEKKQEILFQDVPIQIEPSTVFVDFGDEEIFIEEQKFEYNLITTEKLLEYYVGQEIKILEKNRKTGETKIIQAKLLSFVNNQAIYQINGEVYLEYPGTVIVPEIPKQFTARPMLRWLLENSRGKATKKVATVSYLTRGINWKSDYILHLDAEETLADLISWVTIENQSGALFEKAKIKLVAGDVQRIKEGPSKIIRRMRLAESAAAEQPSFQEEALSEYHLYTLLKPSTLKDQQTTQIPFIQAHSIPIKKEYVFLGRGDYRRRYDFLESPKSVNVYLKFENEEQQNLGLPLPQGAIKVYKKSRTETLEFIGEDFLSHTPKGASVRIKIGKAFDVTGAQKQMEWEKIGARIYESSWQVTFKNSKKDKVTIRVIEPIGGDWKILSSSHPYNRLEARKIEFSVTVPANGEEILTYRIRVEF